jgi:hypothetical protein
VLVWIDTSALHSTAGLTAATFPNFWLIWLRLGHARQRISEQLAALAASPQLLCSTIVS